MNLTQSQIIELLREVHLLAIKEVERLNMRVAELEAQLGQPKMTTPTQPPPSTQPIRSSGISRPEIMNEMQVAEYLNMSAASLRKWRLFREGPKFLKVGRAVRYRKAEVDAWLNSHSI